MGYFSFQATENPVLHEYIFMYEIFSYSLLCIILKFRKISFLTVAISV